MCSPQELPGEDLEDLYENAPCGYLSMRGDGRIYKVNATFCHWMGCPIEEITGKRIHELLNIAGRIFYETHFAPLLRMQGFFNEVALDFVTAQGDRLPVLVNAAERRGPNGEALFVRVTVFNATERRRYERDLLTAREAAVKANNELRELNATLGQRVADEVKERLSAEGSLFDERHTSALREQFIAVLGHDLRNPLASIDGALRLIEKTPLEEKGALTRRHSA